ncbi:MAG: mobile mystery protein B [Gammaproteobacteria bacterium]
MIFEYAPGATPLDLDEVHELIPHHIITQQQLNEWEQVNILQAEQWVSRQQFKISQTLTVSFIKKLHHRMFSKTWRWAGQFRRTNKNIGVDWHSVMVAVQNLIDDTHYQLENASYDIDELAARFHHRLVAIHPFANGNGRHARLMTDIILLSQGTSRFTWGSTHDLVTSSVSREKYIHALRAADKQDYGLLLKFVRT